MRAVPHLPRTLAVLAFAAMLPVAAVAGPHGGGHPAPAPAVHAAPAPVPHAAPGAPGGFDLHTEVAPVAPPRPAVVQQYRPAPVERAEPQIVTVHPAVVHPEVVHPAVVHAAVVRPVVVKPAYAHPAIVRQPVVKQTVVHRTDVKSPIVHQTVVRKTVVKPTRPTSIARTTRTTRTTRTETTRVVTTARFGHRPPPKGFRYAPVAANATGGRFRGHFDRPPIRNPRVPEGRFAWNRGREWNPAPIFWGGGFWGSFALADFAGAVLYGAVEDGQDGYLYDSYRVEPDTPGAELLSDYGLQQTPCGPPNLVDVWGPDGSLVCAFPNGDVGPGEYEVDTTDFTLIPATE